MVRSASIYTLIVIYHATGIAKYKSIKYYFYTVMSTVKLDSNRKMKVERLVASLLMSEGIKITLQETLGLMIDYSLENKDDFVKRLRALPPLEKDPAWKMLEKPDDWGMKDVSEKIDEYLYG